MHAVDGSAGVPDGRRAALFGATGIPTAGRESGPAAGVDDVGVDGLVVDALVVGGAVVCGGDVEVVTAVVVDGDGVVFAGGLTVGGGGAVMTGGGMALAGRRGAGAIGVTEDVGSTFVGVSGDSDAERKFMTITIPPTATTVMGRTRVAVCSNLRRRDVISALSLEVLDSKRSGGSGGLVASRAAAAGRTSGGAMTSWTWSTSASGAAGIAGWVGAAPLPRGTLGTAVAPASTTLKLLLAPLPRALAKS